MFALAHGWLGAISSVFILVVASSGALLAFMGEMFLWQHGDMLRAEDVPNTPYLSASKITHAATTGYEKKFNIMGLLMPHSRVEEVETALVFGLPAGASSIDDLLMLSVNPWSGEYKGAFLLNKTFGHELIDFHHDLMLGDAGILIVSLLSVILIVMALSGVWLWWPRNNKYIWSKLKNITFSQSVKHTLFSVHSFAGVWLCLLILYFSVTGVGLAKPDWFDPLLTPASHKPRDTVAFNRVCDKPLSTEQVEGIASEQFPDSRLSVMFFPNQPNGPYMLNFFTGNDMNKREGDQRIFVHSTCYGVFESIELDQASTSTRLAGMMLSLHGGYSFGNIIGDILVLVTGLGLVLLCVSGLYVFCTRTLRLK